MKVLFFCLLAVTLTACVTDSQGRRESPGDALKRWDDSMERTIDRVQRKTYND